MLNILNPPFSISTQEISRFAAQRSSRRNFVMHLVRRYLPVLKNSEIFLAPVQGTAHTGQHALPEKHTPWSCKNGCHCKYQFIEHTACMVSNSVFIADTHNSLRKGGKKKQTHGDQQAN